MSGAYEQPQPLPLTTESDRAVGLKIVDGHRDVTGQEIERRIVLAVRVAQALADLRERCARAVEEHLIYTGPGGSDPQAIQEKLSDVVRTVNLR